MNGSPNVVLTIFDGFIIVQPKESLYLVMNEASELARMIRATSCYYAQLGVERHAHMEVIRKAYRARAKLLHPDKNKSKDATVVFQRLQEAFDVLCDARRWQPISFHRI